MKKNKIALITGGSRGLGKNMALALSKKAVDVILTYHQNKDEAQNVVLEIESMGNKAIALQLDVENSSTFDAFILEIKSGLTEKFETDKIDFLINNAGVGLHATFNETSESDLEKMFKIHVNAPFFLTQKLADQINEGGGIINISSGLTRFANPMFAAYATMKGAVETLTKYQAKFFGERKIRVNVVAPGAIETDFGGGMVRDNKEMNEMIASGTALGRVGLPDDIGGIIAFLCSDDGKWINGQRLEVSGGVFL